MLHLILSFSFLLSHLTLGIAALMALNGLMLPAYGVWTTLVAVSHPQDLVFLIGMGMISSGACGALSLQAMTIVGLSTRGRG
ncbi:hypothetical protein [Burkholderia vietnamiensis]|uniref:hypothetical protein n=1 Tax=Burkholderia vietnamiensis TaxID=60552 RepID=UPI001CF4B920|nr:hypothetical protein [Burkholderia vietnamiensis]MCA8448941.1 hypothetical protein [Burkholderia vietnamiensis]